MQEEMTGKQQFIYTAKQMGRRSWGSAKAFAVMGFIFSAAECVIEKARAKYDTANTVFAGCVTGGAISAKGGPKAACAGCAGFAAFSCHREVSCEAYLIIIQTTEQVGRLHLSEAIW
ncbi:hypothetical protein SAY86_012629 [Trapa natans]|uniref:Mitochondrial import inner membrane translocase subunit TIM22 n=1 Tax=Trapa natans TaxID=22666 RepID=A0AAN7MDA7_TRANT|nr:hypothetical protein SAY86_012629 [Trapa natans]